MRKLETLEDMVKYAKVGDSFVYGFDEGYFKDGIKATIVIECYGWQRKKCRYNTLTEYPDRIIDLDGLGISGYSTKEELIIDFYNMYKNHGIYILVNKRNEDELPLKTSYELGLEIATFFNVSDDKTLIESIARTLGKLIQEHKYDGLIASLSAHMLSEQRPTSVTKMKCAYFIEQIIKF